MTENEDACRDLSGRRLRLVNADKKLQDWAAGEKQRQDDKQAAKEERERAKAETRAEETHVMRPPSFAECARYGSVNMYLKALTITLMQCRQ